MNKALKKILELRELESFANDQCYLNGIRAEFKIIYTLLYIILVSFIGKYSISTIILLGVVPLTLLMMTRIKITDFLYRLVIPAFIGGSMGLLNPLFDTAPLIEVGSFQLSGGMISFLVLLLKSIFSISMALLLVSTTTMGDIAKGLSTFKIPKALIFLLVLMYRYITILLNEVGTTIEAHSLRSTTKGIHISAWGSLVGQIMIRAYNKSNDVYQAMVLRGLKIDG